MLNINRDLCFYTGIINYSFIVKYYTGLHGFTGKLAKKLAPSFKSLIAFIIINTTHINKKLFPKIARS